MRKSILILCVMTSVFSIAFGTSLTLDQHIFRTACQGNLTRLDSMLVNTSIDTQDMQGRSLLHWAVACKQPDVFDSLVNRGIVLDKKDAQGHTPLYMSVRFQNEFFLNKLTELQEDSNWQKVDGQSLLTKAILNDDLDFVKKLVEKGVDINGYNQKARTSLDLAQRVSSDSIVDWLLANGADPSLVDSFKAKGPYLGEKPPGKKPKIFAKGLISVEEYEFGCVFNREGNEFYYGVDVGGRSEIRFTEMIDGRWTKPKVVLDHDVYGYNDPFLSPDEDRLYFISRQPLTGKGERKPDHDIWYVKKEGNGWSEPINPGVPINTAANEYYISFTKSGGMYFSSSRPRKGEEEGSQDIFFAAFENGVFQEPVRFGSAINTEHYEADVFVDPDEDYMIFCSTRQVGLGRGDLYISFRNSDASWTQAQNMGSAINTVNHELCPYVTPDGKYFFYTSNEDIRWVSTAVFEDLAKESKRY